MPLVLSFTLDRTDGLSLRVTVPRQHLEVLDGLQDLALRRHACRAGRAGERDAHR